MSKLKVRNIEKVSGTNITLGASGDTTTISSDVIKTNVWKDSGGNTLWSSDGSGTVSSVNAGIAGAGLVLISDTAASDDANVTITGLSSAYDEYMFLWIGVKPATNSVNLNVYATNDGTNYTATSSNPSQVVHQGESESTNWFTNGGSTTGTASPMVACYDVGSDADQSCMGQLYLCQPSSTTTIKNFFCRAKWSHAGDYTHMLWNAGYYVLESSAITGLRFSFSSGNIAVGNFQLYGIK